MADVSSPRKIGYPVERAYHVKRASLVKLASPVKRAALVKRVTARGRKSDWFPAGDLPEVDARPPRRVSAVCAFRKGGRLLAGLLVEVAGTPESRSRGLMGREGLPPVCGMLFEGLSGGGSFWMKGCLFPLDVAFADGGGIVRKIYTMPADGGRGRYPYGPEVRVAVEANAGFFRENGITEGCSVESRRLSGGGGEVE